MCSYTRLDRIKNEVIRDKVGIVTIKDKTSETRLRWLDHIKRRSLNALVRKCEMIDPLDCRRGRGWSKKNWNEVNFYYLNFIELMEDMTHDRSLWRSRIEVTDHRQRASGPSFASSSSSKCWCVVLAFSLLRVSLGCYYHNSDGLRSTLIASTISCCLFKCRLLFVKLVVWHCLLNKVCTTLSLIFKYYH